MNGKYDNNAELHNFEFRSDSGHELTLLLLKTSDLGNFMVKAMIC